MKSIKIKILLSVCLLVIISLAIVGGTVSTLMYKSSVDQLEKTMIETAKISANYITEYFATYKMLAVETGTLTRLSSPDISIQEKQALIDTKVRQHGLAFGNIVDVNGQGILSPVDISDLDYFHALMRGEASVSDIISSRTLGGYVIPIAAPLWENGIANTKIVGGVYFLINAKILSEITKGINIGKTGSVYMLDKDGYTIAHKTITVEDRDNARETVKTDKKLAPLVAIEAKMLAGETNFGQYSYDGVSKISAYTSLGLNGWSIAVTTELREFIQSTITAIIVTAIIVIIASFIGLLISAVIANAVTKPVKEIEGVAKYIAEGDLTHNVVHEGNDELGRLASSMRKMVGDLRSIIESLKKTVNGLNKAGDSLAANTEETQGQVMNISGHVERVVQQTQKQLESVSSTSTAVEEIVRNIETLDGGIKNQADAVAQSSAAVEQMVGNITSINGNLNKISNQFMELVEASKNGLDKQEYVEQKIASIVKMSETLTETNKIISDISAQTNLLSMNAAIESAHAGEAGKGFAVVADEIRKLAENSALQSKTVEKQLKEIRSGIESVVVSSMDSKKAFDSIANHIRETGTLVEEVSNAVTEQSEGSKQILEGLRTITMVTQEVKIGASEMRIGSQEILKEVAHLKDNSQSVETSMYEVSGGVKEIGVASNGVLEVASETKEIINDVSNQINRFKID